MGEAAMADVPSRRAGGARQFAKKVKSRLKRRVWKRALLNGDECPTDTSARDGKYRGYLS